MKVYLATWYHTWGEYDGCAGVFSTRVAAEDVLRQVGFQPGEYSDERWCYVAEFELDQPKPDSPDLEMNAPGPPASAAWPCGR